MLDLSKDIHSLSTFKRNSHQFLRRLRQSGNPLILTINGKAELVVQAVQPYQELREQAVEPRTKRKKQGYHTDADTHRGHD